jgi:O-antigen ligase
MAIGLGGIVFLIPLIFQKPEFGLALIAFFLPFERVPTLELGGASIKINHILIAMVFFIFFIKQLASRKLTIPNDPLRYLVILFIASLTLSFAQAIHFERSIMVFLFMLIMFIVYLTVTFMIQDKKILRYVLYGLIIGAAFSAALGLFQFAGDAAGLPTSVTLLKEGYDKSTFGFARVQATAQEPLYFANYIFIPLFLMLVLLIRGQAEKLISNNLAYVLAVALLLNLVLAVSRGAYVGMAVGVLALVIAQAKLILRAKTILITFMIALLVIVGAYLGLIKSEPKALEEFTKHVMVNDRNDGESVVSRVNASEQALDIWQNHKFVGAGLGNFGPIVQGDPKDVPEGGWNIVNNEYLELLAENGVVGLGMFLLVLTLVFLRAFAAIRTEKDEFIKSALIGLTLALFAILVQYLSFSTIYIFHIWFLIALISAISSFSLRRKDAV